MTDTTNTNVSAEQLRLFIERYETLAEEKKGIADDIRDVACDTLSLGKPTGQDAALCRPSAARELGLEGAIHHFDRLVAAAIEAIPPCPGAAQMRALVRFEAERLVPKTMAEEVVRVAA